LVRRGESVGADVSNKYENDTHYLGAIRVRLDQLYQEHPNDPRLREHISDEMDWIDERLSHDPAPSRMEIARVIKQTAFGGAAWDEPSSICYRVADAILALFAKEK